MFTGLIEDVGSIKSLRMTADGAVIVIATHLPLRAMKLGASVAVNGACLTVVKKDKNSFRVDVSPETLARTSLGELRTGSRVNLEQPMRLQDRLGGHLVTGHVDGLATVSAIDKKSDFTRFDFKLPQSLASLLVEKGSVTVDGISLTVNECSRQGFSVMIIPFTLAHTNLRVRRLGDKVNVETDLIGKYVQNLMKPRS